MSSHDLIVLGAGPGGYVAAIRAAQLGLSVACVEKEPALGGTCARVGCIPSKALLESSEHYHQAKTEFAGHGVVVGEVRLDLPAMMSRKDKIVTALTGGVEGLFRKNKIARHFGHARIEGPGRISITGQQGKTELEGKHILIATGSKPAPLKGVQFDGDRIGTSTEGLTFREVPETLVVIGGGYIGLELGTVWNRLGSKVIVLEYLDRILPGTDNAIAAEAQKIFAKQGLEFRLGTAVSGARVEKGKCIVEVANGSPVTCDRVLVAVGRVPNTDNLGLETVGIALDERGRIKVDGHFATNVAGFSAIGDVIGGAMLAHKAEEEGVAFVEHLVTGYGHVDYNCIPSVVYTEPEIAAVGRTEEQLKNDGVEYRKGTFPFIANGRARALGHTQGLVKVLADKKTDRILGVHIIGPRAGDLIAEATAAMSFGATAEDVARTCHAHPTLAEAFKEAAMGVDGRTIHI
ncbi:MAG: dihydrolipoyl dehydrogenase [Planctomycetaceae bacterium]|nr:dihydrolipoyl dehydrogenase [Planctomycetaceae bacterium]